jgi:hypothetical protein
MPSLAGPHFLHFQTPPPDWLAEVGHLSASCASFLWNGLSHDTRRVYSSARTSYEDFCANIMDAVPWPANENVLAEWLSLRARGSTTERALKPDTLQSYLSARRTPFCPCGQTPPHRRLPKRMPSPHHHGYPTSNLPRVQSLHLSL